MDSLRNIVRDPRVAIMLMTAGSDIVTRINARAEITLQPGLIDRFENNGAKPRSVIVFHIQEIYFQCSRALKRADLWNGDTWPNIESLPTAGQILEEMSNREIDGDAYDAESPKRIKKSLW